MFLNLQKGLIEMFREYLILKMLQMKSLKHVLNKTLLHTILGINLDFLELRIQSYV